VKLKRSLIAARMRHEPEAKLNRLRLGVRL
jgi:hypothetical protein